MQSNGCCGRARGRVIWVELMRAEGTDQELLSKLDISVFVLCEIMFIYVLDGPYLMKEMDGTWLDNLNTARFTGHN
jgi:hypothetical protein